MFDMLLKQVEIITAWKQSACIFHGVMALKGVPSMADELLVKKLALVDLHTKWVPASNQKKLYCKKIYIIELYFISHCNEAATYW